MEGRRTTQGAPDMERAALLLRALLVVPQGELDDTHFEKLQTRLGSYAKGSEAEVERFLRGGALRTVQFGVTHEDFRVVSVCWRLLGQLCSHSDVLFNQVHASAGDLFTELLSQARSAEEPLVRDSALHCLLALTRHAAGLAWISGHCEHVIEVMMAGFRSDSHFVADTAVALFSEMVRHLDKPLRFPSTFNVQQLLSNFLENPTEESELKKRTLNLIDALMQHEQGLNLIKQHSLLRRALPLLYSPDRLVRASLLELIADVLQKRMQHLFIGKCEGGDQDLLSINVMGETFWSLFSPPSEDCDEDQRIKLRYRSNVLTALELGAVLVLWPSAAGHELSASIFREVASITKGTPQDRFLLLAKFISTFHTLFVIKALQMSLPMVSDHANFSDLLLETNWMKWLLGVLELHGEDHEGAPHGEDPRVIKLALEVLQRFPTQSWHSLLPSDDGSPVSPGFSSLLGLIRRATDRAVLISTLHLVRHLFADSAIQHGLLRAKVFREGLTAAIRALAIDWNWELRESAMTFIACFFDHSGSSKESLSYAIGSDLPGLVLSRLVDHESYVRAACFTTLANITRTSSGWSTISQSAPDFISIVLKSLNDTEAFVKRAAMDLIISWLESEHSLQNLLQIRDKADDLEGLRKAMIKVMQDFDWEVKLRGVRFLYSLLTLGSATKSATPDEGLAMHTESSAKRRRLDTHEKASLDTGSQTELHRMAALNLFLELDGDSLLIGALKDYERLVRHESACLLSRPAGEELPGTDAITGEHIDGSRLALFWSTVRAMDLAAIQSEAGPRKEEEEDHFLTRHITAPSDIDPEDDEPPFLDCPF